MGYIFNDIAIVFEVLNWNLCIINLINKLNHCRNVVERGNYVF